MKAGIDYIGITTPFYCNDGHGRFLFAKRSVNCRDEHGSWECGGGQLEFGQSLEESVLREVMEEYGVPGEIQERIPAHGVMREWNGQKTHWVSVPFFIKVDPTQVKINEPEFIDEIQWLSLNDLPDPLHPGLRFALDNFPEYFDKYRS